MKIKIHCSLLAVVSLTVGASLYALAQPPDKNVVKSKASHATVPLIIENNRPYVDLEFTRPDGSLRKARFTLWIPARYRGDLYDDLDRSAERLGRKARRLAAGDRSCWRREYDWRGDGKSGDDDAIAGSAMGRVSTSRSCGRLKTEGRCGRVTN